jgi:hypothetical protein
MDTRAGSIATPVHPHARPVLRATWHALAVLVAAGVAWLVFSAYRQPELLLNLADLRLC